MNVRKIQQQLFHRLVQWRQGLAVLLGAVICVVCYHYLYAQFFPTTAGKMGHDWMLAHSLPAQINTTLDLGWAKYAAGSPAACNGGVSLGLFAFPVTFSGWLDYFQYSPIEVAYINFLFFAIVGFWGAYTLSRKVFGCGVEGAFLGAALYMFNGFYASRIIIGHPYYAVMLLPLAVLLLARNQQFSPKWMGEVTHGIGFGLLLFFAWNTGLMYVAATFAFSLMALLCLAGLAGVPAERMLLRGLVGGIVFFGWAWLDLSQSLFSIAVGTAVAQRKSYSMQGFESLWAAIQFTWEAIFIGPADIDKRYLANVVNLSVWQGKHELEYGIGLPALFLMVLALTWRLQTWLKSDHFLRLDWWKSKSLWLVGFSLLMVFPWVYNTYSPLTNDLWKSVPLLGATTSPERTYFIYTAVLCVLIGWGVDKCFPRQWLLMSVVIGVGATIGYAFSRDNTYYVNQPYDVRPVEEAWKLLKQGGSLPPISKISVFVNAQGNIVHDQMSEVNERLVGNQSMGCYVPGYSSAPIERVKTLHPGSVWDESNGVFNIKNPACNTWPKENKCEPGDHFKVEQRDWVERFVNYQPYPIEIPERILLARNVSRSAVILTLFYFLIVVLIVGYRRKKILNSGQGAHKKGA